MQSLENTTNCEFAASENTVATYGRLTSEFMMWITIYPPVLIAFGTTAFLDFDRNTPDRHDVREKVTLGYVNGHASVLGVS